MQALETLCASFDPKKARSHKATVVFDVAGGVPHTIRVQKGTCTLERGVPQDRIPDVTVRVSAADLDRMLKKELGFEQAYNAGRVKVEGNYMLATIMTDWFKLLQ